MRTSRHRSAASRAGLDGPSLCSAFIQEPVRRTPHGRGKRICQPDGILRAVTPRRAVAPNSALIPDPKGSAVAGAAHEDSEAAAVIVRGGRYAHYQTTAQTAVGAAPIPHPARSRGLARGKLRTSLSGLLPPLARTFMAAVMASGLFLGEAQAQRCGPSEGLAQQLRARFGEEVIRTEVKPDGSAVMQLWVNRKTRTWTMVLSTVEPRMSCIIGAGRDYDGPMPEQDEKL